MTAFNPLVKRGIFARTILTTKSGNITGYLKLVDRVSQGTASADELLSVNTGIYQFQQTEPLSIGVEIGDNLTVVNTVSRMVKVGEVLRVVTIVASPIPIVNKLLGIKITLVTNTVRYRA